MAAEPRAGSRPDEERTAAPEAVGWSNPYLLNAIPDISQSLRPDEEAPLAVRTDPLRRAAEHLDGFVPTLSGTPELTAGETPGRIVTVTGGPGMGKTHLALQLAHRARLEGGFDGYVWYVEAVRSRNPCLELFRRFVRAVGEQQLRHAVDRVYTEVVAEDLARSRMTVEVAEKLRAGELSADQVVSRFASSRNVYDRLLEDRLRDVLDGDEAFVRALALLRDPQFSHLITGWLAGYDGPALRENGIDVVINSDETAVRALVQLLLLLGGSRPGVFLVIDEAHLLLGSGDGDAARLRRLLDGARRSRSFILLCGLPELFDSVPVDVRQRLTPDIRMRSFGLEETREYVRTTNRRYRRELPEGSLDPFDDDSLEAVVAASRGVPRTVNSLLAHAFQRARLQQEPVTPGDIWDAAREHVGPVGVETIRGLVVRVLQELVLDFRADYMVQDTGRLRVDFRVVDPTRPQHAVGIQISGPVDAEPEYRRILELGRAAKEAGFSALLLVVNGELTELRRDALTEALGLEPLVHSPQTFGASLSTLLKRQFHLVGEGTAGPVTAEASTPGLAVLNRRQDLTYDLVRQLLLHLESLQASTDRGFASVSRELQRVRAAGPGESAVPALPGAVEAMFDHAGEVLANVSGLRARLSQTFSAAARRTELPQVAALNLRTALQAADVTSALGVVAVLQSLVDGLRLSLTEWYSRWRGALDDPPAARAALRLICSNFDAVYEYLPLSSVQPLRELATNREDWHDRVADASSAGVSRILNETLDNFGQRVYQRLVTEIDG
jgi:hypothetical protein